MGKYESLKEYKGADAKQKLAILAIEMVVPLAVIQGYASILKMAVEAGEIEVPEALQDGIHKIAEAAGDLIELREALLTLE